MQVTRTLQVQGFEHRWVRVGAACMPWRNSPQQASLSCKSSEAPRRTLHGLIAQCSQALQDRCANRTVHSWIQ